MARTCVFCSLPETSIVAENGLSLALRDKFPVNQGHTLVISKRHVESFFELTHAELMAMHELLISVKRELDEVYRPEGYNVGVNVGTAAGQTIPHVHIHVIPRFSGDMPDPRGGVRKVKPNLVPYPAVEHNDHNNA